ncbi:MAG TPA: hypothetical protein VMZ03_12080 [Chitinophagaceae bacterium]|nr:hypothetical protein [Chitinophagaceae bacterium]
MKTILCLLLIPGFFIYLPVTQKECIRITCLDRRDTVLERLGVVRSSFLIESLSDTLSGFDIRSSCGCEYPLWKKQMRIYPGHPDTIVILSSIKSFSGYWQKQTTITAENCTTIFYTGPWIIIK